MGWLQRTERVILLTIGLLVGFLRLPILAFLAVTTLATSVQRMVHVAAKLPGPKDAQDLREAASGPEARESEV